MKSFFEEYGFVILAAIVVILLIAMITPIGSVVKKQITGIIISFDDKTNIKLNTVNVGDNIAKLAYEGEKLMLSVSSGNSTDTFTAYATYTSKGKEVTDEALNIISKSAGKYEVLLANNADKNTNIQIKVINDGTQEVFYSNVLRIRTANSSDSGADTKNHISETESYVGKYADLDGDGIPDGIIFADLAESKSETWGSNTSYGTYSYSAVSNLKDYTISENKYNGAFGEAEIISVVNGSTGNDRFYIMALEDFTTSTYEIWIWYGIYKIADYDTITSGDFGTGKQNTATMISKWNSSTYGQQSAQDLWGAIGDKVNNGWFVPSRAEWAAFAGNLEITKSNYESKGLNPSCWSSSLYSSDSPYAPFYSLGFMNHISFRTNRARLAKTF